MRAIDWAGTPIGPVEHWSEALQATVALLLHNHSPMLLWWGPRFVQLYNDAYTPVPGDKHPRAMGQPADQCWSEIWHIIGPMVERPFHGGPASTSDDLTLVINRRGFQEETHFRVAYSPVPDRTVGGTGIGGVLATVTETTEQIYAERQLRLLRELGTRSTAETRTTERACQNAAATLGMDGLDVPFSVFYLLDETGRRARLVASSGLAQPAVPAEVDLGAKGDPWRLGEVLKSESALVVEDLTFCADALPRSAWSERPRSALTLPLASPDQPYAYGALVCGTSPHRPLDLGYRTFFELAAAQILTTLRNARAYQAQRRRAEQLAELDRAKTVFSNVSHEFRTPLTLMIGPTEDALSTGGPLCGEALRAVHRNALRLLKLVNSLLDFARMESGRAQASFEPTDLAMLTRDLASAFRSALARAGLEFRIDCPPLPRPIYVDRAMWEKVVLNLISNALKFTFEGSITVALRATDEGVALAVSDTGIGIPREELPHLFERFHRIEGQRGRTHEGSGIGLALVAETARMHGGAVAVESRQGQGSTFTVRLRAGTSHLPRERIGPPATLASTALRTEAYTEEALRWLPGEASPAPIGTMALAEAPPRAQRTRGARLLLVDDSADMREYLGRLLAQHWNVTAAEHGVAALEAARKQRPDLILSDVMMPVMDGFGLLREIRGDPQLASIPIILLSARAGEESRVEGLQAGADDYIVKPFAARELIARVATHLELARLHASIERERNILKRIFQQAPIVINFLRGPQLVFEVAHPLAAKAVGRPLEGRRLLEAIPELRDQALADLLVEVFRTGTPHFATEQRILLDHGQGLLETYWNSAYLPVRTEAGEVEGVMTCDVEVTEAVLARREIDTARREAERANRAKDEFLAMLGHELRNPLAPILTALELMRLRGAQSIERERLVIERQARHMAGLIDDLLDISRITRGKIALKRRHVEAAQVIAKALETAAPLLEQRRHHLVTRVPARGLIVNGDPGRLSQLFSNLLTNAAKYSDPGGTIVVSAAREGEELVFRVSDTGRGISPAMLPHVFEAFVQDGRSIDRAEGGLGLGLAIVKSLVEAHGGRVSASSEGVGRGSQFEVHLPAQHGPAAEPAADVALAPRAPRRGSVLVVDDNQDAADTLAESLSQLGYATRIAYDPVAALTLAAGFRPDVAILDLGLPVIDGFELARRLREAGGWRSVKMIALTGYGRDEDRRSSAAAGFDAHLVKPIEIDRLARTLDTLVPAPGGSAGISQA
jgi:signal transduction histidine kinase